MKYLKKYLESNSNNIDKEDLETIKDLFKFVENDLMLKMVDTQNLKPNEYKISFTSTSDTSRYIFIFAYVSNNEISTSEIQKTWSDFLEMLYSYGYMIDKNSDKDVIDMINSVYFGASIKYR
jgi:hypothetical protein